jgi:hypothetical protein
MKKTKLSNMTRIFFTTAFVIVLVCLLESCSRKMAFETSSVVPAAEGSVKLKKDKNSNYLVKLDVVNLAEPQRLEPPKNTYVVWAETAQNGTQNIGQLKTSSGLLSKTLKSSLETTTPFKPTNFFITAEDNANIQYPGGQVVLRTGAVK